MTETDTREGASVKQAKLPSIAYALCFASAVSILFSIALSQVLLGLTIVALLAAGQKLRFPPVRVPLLVFFLLTLTAVLLSGNVVAGWPQVKKFYVFLTLPAAFVSFSNLQQMRRLVGAWTAAGLVSALASVIQYIHRYHLAQQQYAYNYGFFLDGRVTGLASHWMTFGGEQMIVLLMLLAWLLFRAEGRWRWYGIASAIVLYASIVLGLTRSIFLLGVPAGALYLLWKWKRWLVTLVPALVVAELFLGPVQVRERVTSAVTPHEELDSNTHRVTTRRTGWNMIKQHPWFGIGPEQVGPQFLRYLPPDIPRPLPKGYYGHLHNIYLQYAAERGIPAALMLFWLIGKMLRDFYGGTIRYTGNREVQFVLQGAIAVILGVLVEGFFEYNLGDSEILTLFLTVAGCGYRALTIAASESEAGEAVPKQSISDWAPASSRLLHQA